MTGRFDIELKIELSTALCQEVIAHATLEVVIMKTYLIGKTIEESLGIIHRELRVGELCQDDESTPLTLKERARSGTAGRLPGNGCLGHASLGKTGSGINRLLREKAGCLIQHILIAISVLPPMRELIAHELGTDNSAISEGDGTPQARFGRHGHHDDGEQTK